MTMKTADGNFMPRCPLCGRVTVHVGSVGITIHEGDDVQADRIDCPKGHTFLIIDTPEEDVVDVADEKGGMRA